MFIPGTLLFAQCVRDVAAPCFLNFCQLQVGICHLPLQGLNHELLQPLTFNTPWKESRGEVRNEALCILGETGRSSDRYCQEKML